MFIRKRKIKPLKNKIPTSQSFKETSRFMPKMFVYDVSARESYFFPYMGAAFFNWLSRFRTYIK